MLAVRPMYFNRTHEAKAAFEYVTANGNKTCYVTEAREYLNQIDAE